MKLPAKSIEQRCAMAIMGGRPLTYVRVLVAVLLAVAGLFVSVRGAMAGCGCMDVAFVVDDTGSMGGALGNIQDELPTIITNALNASGGKLRMGLVTFPNDNVVVNQPLTNDVSLVQSAIEGLFAGGGNGIPESSDEALQYAVTGAADESCSVVAEDGPFGAFRSRCIKIAVLITDAEPGECNDAFTLGVSDVHAHQVAVAAAHAGVVVSAIYVPTSGEIAEVKAIMQDYARTSHGQFVETDSDGTGTGAGISSIVQSCGQAAGGCSSADDLLAQVDALGLSRSQTLRLERQVATIGRGIARRNAFAARTECEVLGRYLTALVRMGRISLQTADSIASCCESLGASIL